MNPRVITNGKAVEFQLSAVIREVGCRLANNRGPLLLFLLLNATAAENAAAVAAEEVESKSGDADEDDEETDSNAGRVSVNFDDVEIVGLVHVDGGLRLGLDVRLFAHLEAKGEGNLRRFVRED